MFLAIQRSVNTRNIDLSSFFPLTACQRRKKATKYNNNKKLLCRECWTTGFVSFHTHTRYHAQTIQQNEHIHNVGSTITYFRVSKGRAKECVCENSNVQLIYHQFGDFSRNKSFLISSRSYLKAPRGTFGGPKTGETFHTFLFFFSFYPQIFQL